jgi:hypothetical protein
MPIPRSLKGWLRLPGRVALILGLGALSTAAARGDTSEQSNPTSSGDMLIRSEGGKIYLSEGGREFQELQLRDTAEAERLKQIFEHNRAIAGSDVVRLNPTILAGGGGAGFYWWTPAEKTGAPEKAGTPGKSGTPEKAGAPRKTDTAGTGKKG